MRPLFALLALALGLTPVHAEAAVDERLIHRLMSRLSGAEPLDDGTRITSRYVLRPALLDKATEELKRELAACGVAGETSDFHVAVTDFTAVAQLGKRYAVFGKDVLAYASSPTGPFEAGTFPGTAHAAFHMGSAYFAAGEFSHAQLNRGAERWYLAPGRHLTEFQGHVFAAGATGTIYVSPGNAPFTKQAESGIAFGGLAADGAAVWAVSGKQLYKASDGLIFTPVEQSPSGWSAVLKISGRVLAIADDGSLYDVAQAQWEPAPWSGVAPDGWFSPGIAFGVDGDLLFGFRTGIFWDTPEVAYVPVSTPMHAVVTSGGEGLLMAGRRGSLAYLAAGELPRRLDAPVWTEDRPDPRFAVARNLIVHRQVSTLLLSAHLDSIASSTENWNGLTDPAPGADDDLSGVAALAAVACAQPKNRAFDVMFTSGEEVGLAGAYWEALGGGKGYDYETMLTVDEIALKTRMVFIGYQDAASRAFADSLTQGVAKDAATKFFVAGEPTLIARADHYAYFLKGVKTVILSAGVPPPTQYHTIEDTLDRADVQPVIDTARLLERYVAELDPAEKEHKTTGGCSSAQAGEWVWGVLGAIVLVLGKRSFKFGLRRRR